LIYNASVVKNYITTDSLARFESEKKIFYFEKRSSLHQRWRCSCKIKNNRIGSRHQLIAYVKWKRRLFEQQGTHISGDRSKFREKRNVGFSQVLTRV
jgi:hypothetical protein